MSNNTYIKFTTVEQTLNKISSNPLAIDFDTPKCERARLDTGPFCNYDCEFCYYKDKLDVKDSWETVKARADYLLAYGIKQVDLSGGESSVSPDWFKILDYCNERFEHVSCLSHGGKFANKDFVEESKAHGLKEILFSLHGATAEVHDAITNRKGSFERILKGIKNAQEAGLIVRLNCTVYHRNYEQLPTVFADLVNDIKPLEINFITLNYWGDVKLDNVGYTQMTDAIKSCIDRLNGMIINVRYVPYCYMVGYEKYVCDQFQHIYDIYDWNKEVFSHNVDISKQYTDDQKLALAYAEAGRQRSLFYHKDMTCTQCKHFHICDGVEKELAGTPLTPLPGKKIIDVNHYRKDHFK
jgi:MoaA/NifB/PqqE/SkfB family radical SAM enzyme